MKRQVITEIVVRQAAKSGQPLVVRDDAIYTPSARDAIRDLNVQIRKEGVVHAHIPVTPVFRVVGVAADREGLDAKKIVCKTLEDLGVEYIDHGVGASSDDTTSVELAAKVARKVAGGTYWRGIVIDATGIGAAMAANKIDGIRAGNAWDTVTARKGRLEQNINILTLAGQMIGSGLIREIVTTFLRTDFDGGQYIKTVEQLQQIDDEERS